MPDKKLAVHDWHLVFRNPVYRRVLVTPGARESRLGIHVWLCAPMLAVTTETLEIPRWTYKQLAARHQPNVLLAHVETAVRIAVA